jgi:hypothetical protein
MEILVTMLLLTTSLLALAALQVSTIRQVTTAQRTTQANRLAQGRLDFYRAVPVDQLPAPLNPPQWETELQRDGASQMVGVGWDGESNGAFTVQRLVEEVGGGAQVLITIRVSWVDLTPSDDTSGSGQTFRERAVLMAMQRSQ